jgi:hypothetical protein
MARLYPYVEPKHIRERVAPTATGTAVNCAHDLQEWTRRIGQQPDQQEPFGATFVVDKEGVLRVADRRSEHVACAGGGPVLSAGEMFFRLAASRPEVVEVTNQSTGYCPEPESRSAVASSLDRSGVSHPGRFTVAVMFRRCLACGQTNVIKDGWLVCDTCGAVLPPDWNFS